MSDPFTISSTGFGAGFVSSGDEKNNEGQRDFTAETPTASSETSSQAASGSGQHDLRQSFDWLLGSGHEHDNELSQEELQEKQKRRLDLLLWILHLEPRLTPYGEPA